MFEEERGSQGRVEYLIPSNRQTCVPKTTTSFLFIWYRKNRFQWIIGFELSNYIFLNKFKHLSSLLLLLLLSCFSRVRLCDPIDGSPPGPTVPGILQARTLEWVAISFSNAWKWKVKVKSLSHVRPSATPRTAVYQAPLSMGFSRQEYWSGRHCLLC